MIITPEMRQSIPFQYAYDVLAGKILTGEYMKLAVQRFFTWIEEADEQGFYLDHSEGMYVVEFFPRYLTHTKGPDAKLKKPFTLSPFQQFGIYNTFAWKIKGTNLRRIRRVYETMARKNGKTTPAAGVGLYCQALDGEEGPEVYCGATKEAQAKVLWEQAYAFVEKSIPLRRLGFANTQREIRFKHRSNSGVFRFLGGDSKTLDGLNPSVGVIDEYHAHKDDTVLEVIESGMGARDNPLLYIITTAGFNLKSACKQTEDALKDVLKGINKDDRTLILIHQMDDDDDWEDPANWEKSNPNMQYIETLKDFLQSEYTKAINQPSKIPNFKTKFLNMWVDGQNVWIPSAVWRKNDINFGRDKKLPRLTVPIEKFKTHGSYFALDLSTTTDITCWGGLSEPDEENKRYLKLFLFCPEETVDKRSKEDRVGYRYWCDAGYMIATPGNVADYDFIEAFIRRNWHDYGVKRMEVDRWNSNSITNHLVEDGFNVSEFSQTITNYSHPTKVFEKEVYEGVILHDGNPAVEWALSGCVTITDNNDNIRLSKGKSQANGKRIDPIIVSVMARGGSLSPPEDTNESYYNNPDADFTC